MDNRTNTIAGWVLAGLGTALGLSIVGSLMFHAERPEKMGYPIEGVVEEGGAAAESTFIFTEKSSTVEKLTDSIPVTDEQLEDAEDEAIGIHAHQNPDVIATPHPVLQHQRR